MSPFGFLPPFGPDQDLLREARARGEMLREEWRLANTHGSGGGGTLTRARARVGRAIVGLGERLTEEPGRGRMHATAGRTESPC